MSATGAAAYSVRPARVLDERATLLNLWDGSLGEGAALDGKFDWYYAQHVECTPDVLLLCHGAEQTPVGAGTLGPRSMVLNGRTLRAGIRVDLAVAPAHRTLFPAMQLQRAVSRHGLEAFDLLYGMPNPAAEKVVRRLGVQQEVTMTRHVKVLRWSPYLARKLPGWAAWTSGTVLQNLQQLGMRGQQALARPPRRVAWQDRPDESFDALWTKAVEPRWLMGRRDRAFLAWRFGGQPGVRHRFFVMRSARSGRLLAYAACEREGPTKHVRDILVEGQNVALAREFLHRLAIAAYHEGATSLSLEMSTPAPWHHILRSCGFVPRGSRPLFLDWSATLQGEMGQNVTLYATDADEDQ